VIAKAGVVADAAAPVAGSAAGDPGEASVAALGPEVAASGVALGLAVVALVALARVVPVVPVADSEGVAHGLAAVPVSALAPQARERG